MKPVAIVSTGMVLPKCQNIEAFWQIVSKSQTTLQAINSKRWQQKDEKLLGSYGDQDRIPHRCASPVPFDWRLDSRGLDIDPALVSQLDPGVQFALSACRDALEKTAMEGVSRDRVGVILGAIQLPTDDSYRAFLQDEDDTASEVLRADLPMARLHTPSASAYWVAKSLGLGGRAYTLDAACASSIYALKHAIDELNSGESDLMLSGGVCRPDLLYTQMGFTQLQALSKRGQVRPFDKDADGLLVGEGAVVFGLKRLDDAIGSGDQILAVIRGIGLSNDDRGGLMVPQNEGQMIAMRDALSQAQWQFSDIDYVECHATGTPVGDRVEFNSLIKILSESEKKQRVSFRDDPVILGAGKSNFGHLLTGAGALGLLRCVAAMHAGQFPPTANFHAMNDESAYDQSGFRILSEPKIWPHGKKGQGRRAAVNAFGFGGTNAHLLLEQWVQGEEKTSGDNVSVVGTGDEKAQQLGRSEDPLVVVASAARKGPKKALYALPGQLGEAFEVSYFDEVEVPIARFRIPPRDLQTLLPQQLLTLLLADELMQKAHLDQKTLKRSGVYVGLELDPSTHRFANRWRDIDSQGSPSLTAEHVLGSLASLSASRVAKYFRSQAPCVTFSQQRESGVHALWQAMADLNSDLVEHAFVIAADFPSHRASILAHHRQQRAEGKSELSALVDAAVGIVVMKRSRAERLNLKPLLTLPKDKSKLRSYLKSLVYQEGVYHGAADGLFSYLREGLGLSFDATDSSPASQGAGNLTIKFPHADFISKQKPKDQRPLFLDYKGCCEFAVGEIANCFGEEFAEVDSFPSRVRLPSDKLLLCHRVVSIGGEPKSLGSGSLVTEHDVSSDSWYLDNGRIPAAIAIEAGQADLLLSAWLGADYETKGKAYYRLLDAMVTFHNTLPVAGDMIRYDIEISQFFKQAGSLFFRFSFRAFSGDSLLMTMTNGCAGFFTPEQLSAGKGIAKPSYERRSCEDGRYVGNFEPIFHFENASYTDDQIDALRAGDLKGCFGSDFQGLNLKNGLTIPGGDLRLVHRVHRLDSHGGWYHKGFARAEADIDPESWFLHSHFKDDPVMPGTLMYECCLHTLRIFMMRMGFVDEASQTHAQPLIGRKSKLNCRGQVLPSTKTVQYELHIREIGFGPDAFAVVDAVMFADNRAIVDIQDMTVSFPGLNESRYKFLWNMKVDGAGSRNKASRQVVFTENQIRELSSGLPSRALGPAYRAFDQNRHLARLPRGPLQLITAIESTSLKPGSLASGGEAVSMYEWSKDAWFFSAYDLEQVREKDIPSIPYAVLLEIGLQCCGWMAAYMGAALTSDRDLYFRNLQGRGKQLQPVTNQDRLLRTHAKCLQVSKMGHMIILNFELFICNEAGAKVFTAESSFGFFDKNSLNGQKGLSEQICSAALKTGISQYREKMLLSQGSLSEESSPPKVVGKVPEYLSQCSRDPWLSPSVAWLFLDEESVQFEQGKGAYGKGRLIAHQIVDPDDWFFHAHFLNDPVMPGSLGLEGLIQAAVCSFSMLTGGERKRGLTHYQHLLMPDTEHEWTYRGQVLRSNQAVFYDVHVKQIDHVMKTITFDGYLWVDNTPIYQIKNFSLQF